MYPGRNESGLKSLTALASDLKLDLTSPNPLPSGCTGISVSSDNVSLDPDTRAPERSRPDAQVICRKLGEGAVLIHLETNQIYELNMTGHRIWELLEEGLGREEIRDRIQQEFSVASDRLSGQVDDLLDRLSAEQLVTTAI